MTVIPPYSAASGTPPAAGVPAGGSATPAQSVAASGLDPDLANKPLPGAARVNQSPAPPPAPFDTVTLVQELATHLGVKATKGKNLETAVVQALASKYGVQVAGFDGTRQAAALRDNIGAWYQKAVTESTPPSQGPPVASLPKGTPSLEQINEIKSPKLRELALKKFQATYPDLATPESADKAQPESSKNALDDMLAEVGKKLGVSATTLGQGGLANIAKAEGLPTGTAAAGPVNPGTTQTAGDAYQSFIKELADPKTGAKFASTQVTALQDAGLLDKNAAGAKQANGTTYTNDQISTAYQAVLQQQVTNNQSEAQALAALAANTVKAGGPTSEIESYVEGVATEFGVGLTQQQITAIANQYGANAAVADNPASVADEIKDAVVALYDPTNASNPAGIASTMFTDIQQAALSYQIPISAQQIGQMVKTDLQGATVESMYVAANAAEAAATKQFQTQAQGLYPALSDQIAAGQTVQNLVAPYFNVAQAYTGVPAASMMADQQSGGPSKWSAFLQGGQNASGSTKTAPGTTTTTGGPQMMTLDEWKHELMSNPTYGFDKTQGGRDMAEQMTSAILNEFGKVNTQGGTQEPFNVYSPSQALSANSGG